MSEKVASLSAEFIKREMEYRIMEEYLLPEAVDSHPARLSLMELRSEAATRFFDTHGIEAASLVNLYDMLLTVFKSPIRPMGLKELVVTHTNDRSSYCVQVVVERVSGEVLFSVEAALTKRPGNANANLHYGGRIDPDNIILQGEIITEVEREYFDALLRNMWDVVSPAPHKRVEYKDLVGYSVRQSLEFGYLLSLYPAPGRFTIEYD